MHTFDIIKTRSGTFRAVFKYNGRVTWRGEPVATRATASNQIASIKKHAPGAEVIDDS